MKGDTLRVRRGGRRGNFLMFMMVVAALTFSFLILKNKTLENEVKAANLSQFNAGYIISDWQMTSYTSMSEADIQSWLTMRNPCDNTDENYFKSLSATSVYEWHFENGHFVCLSEERFGDNDDEIGFSYKESAAHIIWQAAQDYKINPKVLLVLLQKETGLITDKIPNNGDYRKATGYGCPDTAACSSKYYGFKNQVRNAAYLFRIVMNGDSSYYPVGNNYVKYNPNAACGGTTLYIQNLATSALYRYTPYQPNAGALAAGYGEAPPCGSYGNRNFFSYFQDWFGGITETHELKLEDLNQKYIVNGVYSVNSAQNGRAMMVSDNKNAGNIYAGDKSNKTTDAQKWRITKEGNYYTIINEMSGRAVDVMDGSFMNNRNVWQIELNRTCAQRWVFNDNSDGTVTIHNACRPEYVLDLEDGKTNVQIYASTRDNNKNQRWNLELETNEDFSGVYNIVSQGNGKVLMIENEKDGGNVYADIKTGILAQEWRITKQNEYYVITNKMTGKSLDIANGNIKNNNNVWQFGLNKTCAQRWIIGRNADGSVTIYNACDTKYVLDLQDGKTNLQVYENTGSSNKSQKWILEKSVAKNDYDGVYNIVSARNGKGMMVENSVNMGNVFMDMATDVVVQEWEIKKQDNYYMIVNKLTGRSLDVKDANFVNNANVWQIELNKTCAQRWLIGDDGAGSVVIYNACNPAYVLDLQDGTTNVQLYRSTGDANQNQRWRLVKATEKDYSGTYKISSARNGKTMRVSDSKNAGNIYMDVEKGDEAEKWQITRREDYYTITNKMSGRAIDVRDAKFVNNANVWQIELNKTCAQRWLIGDDGAGSVVIYNACNPAYVLDLQDGTTNVQLYRSTNDNNKNQRWGLTKI